ncbi:hypothetical protein B0O80DRAFT_466240 [Mortierella sp. GBAus27b]|nr:hypothetical protein B0O80DRAFT_466240 [Mortierella sp. GBAus27b]
MVADDLSCTSSILALAMDTEKWRETHNGGQGWSRTTRKTMIQSKFGRWDSAFSALGTVTTSPGSQNRKSQYKGQRTRPDHTILTILHTNPQPPTTTCFQSHQKSTMCRSAYRYRASAAGVPVAPPMPIYVSFINQPIEETPQPDHAEEVDTEDHRAQDVSQDAHDGQLSCERTLSTDFVVVLFMGILLALALTFIRIPGV